jgi:propanol-preferring alcohol dehydrogenase
VTATVRPPVPLDGAILFAPAGELVPAALSALDRGGTLAVAGIWPSDVPALGHQDTPFQERTLCTVTANTREDGQEFLALAERFGIRPQVATYPMADAPTALTDLAHGRVRGAAELCAG